MTDPNSRNLGERPPDSNSPEDAALVRFLRANAAPVSPSPSSLEDQVMVAIAQQSSAPPHPSQKRPWRSAAVVGAGIAIIGISLLQVQQWFTPSEFSTAQLEELDSYMTSSFDLSDAAKPLAEFDWDAQTQIGGQSQLSPTQAVLNLEE